MATERYYFNRRLARCERFSGCEEREINNFDSLEDCQEVCEGVYITPTDALVLGVSAFRASLWCGVHMCSSARPDCSAVLCLRPPCDDPIFLPGQCCGRCPNGELPIQYPIFSQADEIAVLSVYNKCSYVYSSNVWNFMFSCNVGCNF